MASGDRSLDFDGPLHREAIDAARVLVSDRAIDLVQVRAILEARLAYWLDKSRLQSKCGADLMGLQACRGVLALIAGVDPGDGDAAAWAACPERRALAAIDSESVISLRARPMTKLAADHPFLMAACRVLRVDDLFKSDKPSSVRRRAAKAKAKSKSPERVSHAN